MIEFNGRITGKTEKYYWSRERSFVQNAFIVAYLVLLPFFILIFGYSSNWIPLMILCISFPFIFILVRIPKSKKEIERMIPRRIYVEDEYIICESNAYQEYRAIQDTKKIIDYGEWYSLFFPFGKITAVFVCQKNLLVQGTLEEFEALFEGKIVRKIKTN